jgi:hypothetical protein
MSVDADEQRRRSPDLTCEQAFNRCSVNPANAALAARAHRRPQPVMHYPFPVR